MTRCCVEEGTCARGRVGSRWDAACETLPMNLHGTLPHRKKDPSAVPPPAPPTHTDSYSLRTTEIHPTWFPAKRYVSSTLTHYRDRAGWSEREGVAPWALGTKGQEAGPQSSLPCVPPSSSVASVSKERVRILLSCTSTHSQYLGL